MIFVNHFHNRLKCVDERFVNIFDSNTESIAYKLFVFFNLFDFAVNNVCNKVLHCTVERIHSIFSVCAENIHSIADDCFNKFFLVKVYNLLSDACSQSDCFSHLSFAHKKERRFYVIIFDHLENACCIVFVNLVCSQLNRNFKIAYHSINENVFNVFCDIIVDSVQIFSFVEFIVSAKISICLICTLALEHKSVFLHFEKFGIILCQVFGVFFQNIECRNRRCGADCFIVCRFEFGKTTKPVEIFCIFVCDNKHAVCDISHKLPLIKIFHCFRIVENR